MFSTTLQSGRDVQTELVKNLQTMYTYWGFPKVSKNTSLGAQIIEKVMEKVVQKSIRTSEKKVHRGNKMLTYYF